MIRDIGDKTAEVLDIWSRVKGDNLNSSIVAIILVVVFALCVWQLRRRWRAYRRRQAQQRRRRRKGVRR